jgi:hypothetical protein
MADGLVRGCHQFSESSCKIVKEAAYFSGQPSGLMEESCGMRPNPLSVG